MVRPLLDVHPSRKLSAEHRAKISMAVIGRKKTEEHRLKISRSMIGKKRSEAVKFKISEGMMGNKSAFGRKVSNETRERLRKANTGKRHSEDTKRKLSLLMKGRNSGSDHYLWKGGSKNRERNRIMESYEYRTWRKEVFERDDYTCQECGRRGGDLNADHIKPFALYPDLRFDVDNGRTLCVGCHRKTPTYGFGAIFRNVNTVSVLSEVAV